MLDSLYLYAAGLGAVAVALPGLKRRLELSRAKHPSLGGHSRLAKRVASLVPHYEFDDATFFRADGAADDIARRRRGGFVALSGLYRDRFAKSAAFTEAAAEGISDLQFTGRYRVPFPFSRHVRRHLRGGSFVQASAGVKLTDLDGNDLFDLTGSY
ncbi:MAG: hypothetical protein NDI88_07230, partial [Lysobacter sp.]|nr:hypothetical protein [Lysobacter sp.]